MTDQPPFPQDIWDTLWRKQGRAETGIQRDFTSRHVPPDSVDDQVGPIIALAQNPYPCPGPMSVPN